MHIFWVIFLAPAVYQVLSAIAGLSYLYRRASEKWPADITVPISVLKPVRGLDPNTYPAFVSQIRQQHPKFEVLFGARDPADPALEQVRRLQREFPEAPIRIVVGAPQTPNPKVGVLQELSAHAQYPLRVVNDSDIEVDSSYLARVTAPLADPHIGVVTCPYRVEAHNLPSAWEALGIATDFMPSALVAQTLGVREFGFGSTLAFRAADLESAGGFAAINAFVADDYHLARSITALGKRALLSTYVVETSLGHSNLGDVWLHQLRWGRTIRATKGAAYAGLPITHTGIWMLLALLCAAWLPALVLLALRLASAWISTFLVLRSRRSALLFWLAPLWDLYSFAVWCASYAGNQVRWRNRTLEIDRGGRIKSKS